MMRPAMLALGILCASAIGAGQAQQRPQGQDQQGSQQPQSQQGQQGQNQQGSQQKQGGQPQLPSQDEVPKDALERAFYHANKLKNLLEKLGEVLTDQWAHAGHLPPELASSLCDAAQQVDQLDSLLTSDIYHAAIDQLQRTGDFANKAAEDALEGAEEDVRALIKAKVGWGSDEPQPPADSYCPEFPPDYKPPETPPASPRAETEPPERRLGDKPGELRPTDQVMVRRETGRPSTPIELIPAPWAVTVATDRVQWCTFGPARGIATGLTPTDAKVNLIASVAPVEAAATDKTTPSATDRPPSTPRTSQAVAEQPKQVAPRPLASLLPRARPAPTTPRSDNPSGAGTPEQPNTTEQTAPATPPPAVLNTRSPSASDRPAPTPPMSNRPPGNPPSARTPEQPQMTDRTTPPSDNPAPPTTDLVPTPVTVTIDINEKATAEVVAKNVEEAKPKAEPSAAVKLKWITPDLPGSGEKTAHDEGSEKNPAAGRVGEPITTDEPQTYGMASGPGAPTHYRAEIDTPEHSGFVAETTGKPVKAAELGSALPAGIKATIDTVRFGGQTHTRLGLDWPRSQKVDLTALADSVSRAIGATLGIDTCRRTKPAPAFGPESTSVTDSNNAVPASTIKLPSSVGVGRTR